MKKVVTLASLLAVAACSGGQGNPGAGTPPLPDLDIPFMPTPVEDAFYAPPNPLPEVAPGTVLKSREATFAPGGVPLPHPAWQLQYMSRDKDGRPQAAIATVVQPLVPRQGGPVLLSYQFAINSAGLKCAPSHQVTGGRDNSNSQLEALIYVPEVLALGWTLVFPDHLGPTSSVAIGGLAAPIVLDGIRAALAHEPAGLAGDAPVGMMGYSGGALATTWAAALQPDHAPELNIVGVAAGGLPADVETTVKAFDGSTSFDIAFAAIISANRVFPQLLPPGLLNEKGLQAAESVKDGCVGDTTDGSPAPSGRFADYVTVADLFATPGALEVLPQLKLPQPGAVPTAEIYFYHQTLDQLAPVGPVDAVVEAWCAAGTRIHYFKDTTGEHYAGAGTSVPTEWLYLRSRFENSATATVPAGTVSCN